MCCVNLSRDQGTRGSSPLQLLLPSLLRAPDRITRLVEVLKIEEGVHCFFGLLHLLSCTIKVGHAQRTIKWNPSALQASKPQKAGPTSQTDVSRDTHSPIATY